MLNSIYEDNQQRTFVVGNLQKRIDYLETVLRENPEKESAKYKHDLKECNSLKDFLFFNS